MTFLVLAIETNSASRLLLHSALLFGRKIYGFTRLDSPLPRELSPASYHSLRLLVSSPHRVASSTSAVGMFCFHRKALIWQTGARRVSPVLIASTVEYEMLRVEDTEEGRGARRVPLSAGEGRRDHKEGGKEGSYTMLVAHHIIDVLICQICICPARLLLYQHTQTYR